MRFNELDWTRVWKLDGAIGTMIQRHDLSEDDFRKGLPLSPSRDVKGDNECLNLSRPDVIRGIHQAYVDAGADIIETNSFGANSMVQGDYGLGSLAPQMAFEAARIAREVADAAPRKVLVAGSMGPGSKSLSLPSDYFRPEWRPCSFDEMASSYEEEARELILGGVDLILIETCFDALNAKAALFGVEKAQSGFPVIVSVSVSSGSGRCLTGQSLEAFFAAVSHAPLVAFGLNCSMGAEVLLPVVKDLARWCPVPVICYPNAGLPNASGGYDESPETMARHMAAFDGLVNIAGGCCGTTPAHIRALPVLKPRQVPEPDKSLLLSGLEAYRFESGDMPSVSSCTNALLSEDFARMMSEGEFDEALMLASAEVEAGAEVLDVCMDGLPDATALMERFVRMIQCDPSVSRAALMIDSADTETLVAGLKNAQGRCLARSASHAEGEADLAEKARLIRSLGAFLLDE